MNCPHCSAVLASDAGECRNCGFSVRSIRALLGAEWVRLERLTDNGNCLSLKEQRHLEIILDEFERTFPQCFFAVYLGALPPTISARDLGFWLINHGAFHTREMAKRNDFGCALVIDDSRETLALTVGYALEGHLSEAELQRILKQSCMLLEGRHFGAAIERVVELTQQTLSKAAQPRPETAPNNLGRVNADLGEIGLQPLRAAHRPARQDVSRGHPS
ncbi:hypothetical protein SAMN02745166_03518 [Prosthecobacter debontii]|uniref:TPM domain-containing protein n=1 Tax=Prosthecobacter debontii TaxID=48467 RepID=A0A1T4YKG2_9BACT|nr:hypothetical protein [Prosthecobacter debontii]SKB02038.1 hypothetical protein SAMN02745166_03518 [Prosthecobacter debontii]